MKNKVRLLALLCVAGFMLVLSCKSAPPKQDDLDRLNAALNRARTAREGTLAVWGQRYFPDEWKKAEKDFDTGRNAGKETLIQVNDSIELLNSTAAAFDAITEKATPRLAKEMEELSVSLEAAKVRAEQSRKDAQGSRAQSYFPDDWEKAEDQLATAKDYPSEKLDQLIGAVALFNASADMYDDMTARTVPLIAQEKALKDLEDAAARAEKSRQQAMDVGAETYFPNDWNNAESALQAAKEAGTETTDEITEAAAQFTAAANAYDDVAKKSSPLFTKERDDASRALQAAIARLDQSRKQATDARGQANFPNEWRDAESKNQAAQGAKKATAAEMKAAVPLYTTAADAYDDIVRKGAARASEEGQKNMNDAKALADKARQAAMDAKANLAVPDDFNKADGVYRTATTAFNAKSFGPATDGFKQAATQFTAAANAVDAKRRQADDAVAKAKTKSAESATHAKNMGQLMDGDAAEGKDYSNQYLLECNKLITQAEQASTAVKYDEAIRLATEAQKNAQLSDDYATLQVKIKGVNEAIAATEPRINRAKETGAAKTYAEIFDGAEAAFTEAVDSRTREEWDKSLTAIQRSIALLDTMPGGPMLAAQYRVTSRDNLWNIAAKPEIYGNPFQWRNIYNANRDKMPESTNPNLINPGMILDIPSISGETRAGILEGGQ
jgi:hypothetical protein